MKVVAFALLLVLGVVCAMGTPVAQYEGPYTLSVEEVEAMSPELQRSYIESHPMVRRMVGLDDVAGRGGCGLGGSGKRESVPADDPRSQWFTQRLDHFNFNNNATWQQRYMVNDTFYTPGGPVFIFLDGEASMTFFEFQEASAVYWAQQSQALYISLEHRYYGASLPFDKFSTDNMAYLSSQQALADAARFIDWYNSTLPTTGPWIVFGCSYSGALSAWFRAKYPNSVIASVAPSGPVQAEMNFTAYYGQFSKSADPDCVNAVSTAVKDIQDMIDENKWAELGNTFNSCQQLNSSMEWAFKMQLMGQVGSADQMDNPPDWPLNQTCAIMTQSSNYVQNWADTFPSGSCTNFDEEEWIKLMRLEIPNSGRSWQWQKCTEFGFWKPSYPGTSIFWGDVVVEPMMKSCELIFGIPHMLPKVEWTNTFYGGYDLKATNVLFTNGNLDPWANLSIRDSFQDGTVQAVTYDAGHCATMDAPYPSDPPSLQQARVVVENFLSTVLNEYYSS